MSRVSGVLIPVARMLIAVMVGFEERGEHRLLNPCEQAALREHRSGRAEATSNS